MNVPIAENSREILEFLLIPISDTLLRKLMCTA